MSYLQYMDVLSTPELAAVVDALALYLEDGLDEDPLRAAVVSEARPKLVDELDKRRR